MSSEIAITVQNLCKHYQIYAQPKDRLKQFLLPRLQKILGKRQTKFYKEFKAIDDISFEVRKGETVGIIGRNGSGKSTLLQMICGTITPTSGHIETRGRIAALLELGSGFNPEFTGRENVYLNASILGLTEKEIDASYQKILDFADIGDFINQPTKTYSSGMMVRLAFSVIAHVNADILVIDEALAVGDAFFTQKCMRFLRNFMETGTIFFVSHDTNAIRSLCNRAIWIDKGVLIEEGRPKELCEHYLEEFFKSQQTHLEEKKQTNFSAIDESQILDYLDQRNQFINNSNLRNDLKIFRFNPSAASLGTGDAIISSVKLLDESSNPLSWVVGGELVALEVVVSIKKSISSPIVGFFIKDRLGQNLFGDNTFLEYIDQPLHVNSGQVLIASFGFRMPRLPAGEYSITIAVAEGNQSQHVHHHWIHDAMFFVSESSSDVSGLVGIPMHEIKMRIGLNA